ncbi:MAG: hypothetical protein KYX69_08995 [Sphingomonas sp.]|uniref:hypothetical protein n=1 Tax=Sphingomonas sp. TaxID=28214 RepID=UPI0026166196|nr:hypothetical protein [Sphingomonas sp.]MDK2767842.1 hypothetical protein [Sphingomonas sp.]
MSEISNKERGQANHQALIDYFDRVGAAIPRKPDGAADIAAIVRDAPLNDRQAIYQNKRNRDLCNERFALHDIPAIAAKGPAETTFQRPGAAAPDEEKKALRRQNDQLQKELLVARAEAVELRRQMRRYKAIEIHLADTGRLPR